MSFSANGLKFSITGGTGSFGSTMTRHLLDSGAEEVRVFSRDEAKQDQMRTHYRDNRLRFYLGDTRDKETLRAAISGVDYVFHAAALKTVPSAEFFPLEAVKTNVIGSQNVIDACFSSRIKKALMEKTASALAREHSNSPTVISSTRYGNVMYSRGSVIPRFISQIRAGGPITITDPNMTRFLMSLEDSVQLVEHAFEYAKTGDLFVKKAPSATIGALYEVLIDMFAEDPIPIVRLGYRHGEKLYESLLSSEEKRRAIDEGEYFRLPLDARDLDYELYFDEGDDSDEVLDPYHSHNADQLDGESLKSLLMQLPAVQAELAR